VDANKVQTAVRVPFQNLQRQSSSLVGDIKRFHQDS